MQAATDNYVFRHYTIDDGLSNNGVRAICQDRYGFMWFGLDNGLCRYDGVRIVTYRHNIRSYDQFVPSLYADDDGLWIGTGHGLTRMLFNNERFTPFTMKAEDGKAITSTVLAITADKRGRLWISTQGQGVFRFDEAENSLRHYAFNDANGEVTQVVIDRDGSVWAVPRQGRAVLYRLDRAERRFIPFTPQCPYNLDYEVSTMIVDSKGRKWMGTRNHGLACITPDGHLRFMLADGQNKVRKIHSILEIGADRLLVGSDDGLAKVNVSTGEVSRYSAQNGRTGALSDRFIYPLVLDREGGIWIGTFYGGVNYVAPNSGQFGAFTHTADAGTVGGNIINRFAEDRRGNIWIASDDGGLNRLNPVTGRIDRQSVCAPGLTSGNVHGLWADADALWVGTYTGGIFRLSLNGGGCKRYAAYESKHPVVDAMSGYSLFRDSHGTLWNGSLESVSRYDSKADRFVFVKRLGSLILDIDEDWQGRLWFATQGMGLFTLDPRTGKWRSYRHDGRNGCLPADNVSSVFVDSAGRIIVATQGGLCAFKPETNSFEPFGPDLKGLEASAITEDNHTYWITTVNGLVRFRQGEEPRWFNKSDGLQSNQFFPNAILRASDGRIYVGTNFGFNSFLPSRIRINKTVPTVAITGLEILNRPVSTGSETLPLAINHLDHLDLTHGDNVFTLLFAAQSYCTPDNNRYAYRLDGFDHGWNYVGSTTRATYTNLSPGTYTFRVKATNNDGVWSEQEAALKIVVHPPFYLSTPMKVIYFLLIAAVCVFGVRLLLRRAEHRHREETERLRAEKEREVRDAKIGFFTMIAHEIRTPVSLIIGPLENILKSTDLMPKAVSDDLNIIDRNAHRLLYLVNQLLDFRKVEQKSLVTHFTLCNVACIVRAVSERFKPTFQQKGIEFDTVCEDENLSAVVDSEAVTKVISNLLSNAVKYGRSKVTLKSAPCDDGRNFSITVSDDGQGVKTEDRSRIFRPFFQAVDNKPGTGIGLSIVKNIVDRHNGTITVDSAPGQGSVFTVIIPIDRPGSVVGENVNEETTETGHEGNTPATDTQTTPADTAPTADGERQTVLVVEDNEELLSFITNNLRRTYNVLTAKNGIEALTVLENNNDTALVLSDWMMPRMDGDELCRRVRSNRLTSHLPFILLTAKTDAGSKIEGLRCGADSYIEKPFSMEYLEERIKNLINMRRLLREKFSGSPLEPIKSIAPTEVDDDFLTRMQQIIEENFSNPDLSVNYLASRLSISRSGLFAKIKSLSGMTPNEMIALVRLKKAATLLKEKKYQINEICYMVGFSNPSYFSKCFKKQFGITPAEFSE